MMPLRGDPLLFGWTQEEGLVAVEHLEERGKPDTIVLFFRHGDRIEQRREVFHPFIVADIQAIGDCPIPYEHRRLKGPGRLNIQAFFRSWHECVQARDWLTKTTRIPAGSPEAPYLALHDPVQQYLTASGRTLFLGMEFDHLRRLQVDIECRVSEGFEFCHAEREGDAIVAIALNGGPHGCEVLTAHRLSEKNMIEQFVRRVREWDPDVLEGHNLFNFDLPYLAERARRHGVALALGRDGSVARRRSSRFSAGERTLTYDRFEIFGRHVVDTLFLVHAYDITHRSLNGFGLKEVATHFGVAAPDREYLEGHRMGEVLDRDPHRLIRYATHDVQETRAISDLLSKTYFVQAQMLPFSYQNVCVRGTAAKIDALMLREYLRIGAALPQPDQARPFEGGYTDLFVTGVVRQVHHCDVRSLYPSLMLTHKLAPKTDTEGVFLRLLEKLRTYRLETKERMKQSHNPAERTHLDAFQSAFKVLINSFYGYLGFAQSRFSDFDAAERVTAKGRELLRTMIEWLRQHGAQPIEIDTDGIYFLPPPGCVCTADGRPSPALEAFRAEFVRSLPKGIEVEFNDAYEAMYSYKMKNYALLTRTGEIVIKGAALKSRGLEPFQRDFLESLIRLRLEGREAEIPALKQQYEDDIQARRWPIERLAKTETLQDAPATYAARQARGQRARNAAYELALRSGRPYRAGDQVSYYVTGTKKTVAVHEAARLVSEWNPKKRDENIFYYLAKLDALYKKVGLESSPKDERSPTNNAASVS